MDLEDLLPERLWCDYLLSFVASSYEDSVIVDVECRSPPLVKHSAYACAEFIVELFLEYLFGFDRIKLLGFLRVAY